MKICFLAPSNSGHTIKWCNYFSEKGYEVHVVSFLPNEIENATVHFVDSGVSATSGDGSKLKYIFQSKKVKRIIKEICPDVISVHYASSYGAVAARAGVKDYYLSVWGSDIFEFPKKSFLHKILLKYSLKKAKCIFSTSHAMAKETKKYIKPNKDVFITPFGVKTDLFTPQKRNRTDTDFVVATVKSLAPVYGIDYLIKAVAIIKTQRKDIPLKVKIAGKGTHEQEYKDLAKQLGVEKDIDFLGFISQEEAANVYANADIAVIPSISESFGVSAVEAQSSGIPVIISDEAGLKEATSVGLSSIVVEKRNENQIASAVIDLYDNSTKRKEMGKRGREFVMSNYEYNSCFERIEEIFKENANDREIFIK